MLFMATEKEIVGGLEKIQNELPGFIGASVVDLESGMTLATRSARPEFDLAAASAFNSEMVKMKLKTMRALNLKSSLEDMLLTLSDQIHIIRMIGAGAFLYLAVDRSSANLAIVRNVVSKHAGGLG
jgi:hypothetical protein